MKGSERVRAHAPKATERLASQDPDPLIQYEHVHRYRLALELLQSARSSGATRVLDLACGSGYGTRLLRESGLHVIALDLDRDAARSAGGAMVGRAESIPLRDRSVDVVICFEAIEHVERPDAIIAEIARVLDDDGLAIVSTPAREIYSDRVGTRNPFHLRELSNPEFRELMAAHFAHTGFLGQSSWAGSWICELDAAGATPAVATHADRTLRILESRLPVVATRPAPWTREDDAGLPVPMYLIALCTQSEHRLADAREALGRESLLSDPDQLLLGHYLEVCRWLVEQERVAAGHAANASDLQRELSEARAHASNLETELSTAGISLQDLRNHGTNLERLVAENANERLSLGKHVENLEALVRARDEHVGNLESELSLRIQRIESLELHARNLEIERQRLEDGVGNLEIERHRLEEQIGIREAEIERIRVSLEYRVAGRLDSRPERLRILHVVHDFLPLHVSGVEVYTDQLARRQAREHDVALLFSEVVADAPNFALRRGQHAGIPTYEIVNNHRFGNFEQHYELPAIDERVREVLDEFRPDVVHIQHLLNLSIGIVAELVERRIPIVMTLHDHWLACANGGQRIHRELGRCDTLDAERCGSCTAHMHGMGAGLRGAARRSLSRVSRTRDRIDLTRVSPIRQEVEERAHVYVDQYSIDGENRPTLVAHPPARISFDVELQAPGQFTSFVGLHPSTFEAPGPGVRFEIHLDGKPAATATLDPKRRASDREPARLAVRVPEGRHTIELATFVSPSGPTEFCTAGWIAPQLSCEAGVSVSMRWWLSSLRRISAVASRLPAAAQTRRIRDRWTAIRKMASEVDVFLAPSRYLADELTRFGLPANRVLHCDYGFPVEAFRRRADPPERARRFAFVGSLVRHKGVHVLLEAFEDMPQDATLDVCGSFGYDPTYSATLREMSTHPGVCFRGSLPPDQVPEFLSGMDCLVVPSIWQENSPLTIHEAFLAGVPVVSSRMGGSVELIENGGGLLYDPDDAAELHAQLMRLYSEPGLVEKLVETAPPVKSLDEHDAELTATYRALVAEKAAAI